MIKAPIMVTLDWLKSCAKAVIIVGRLKPNDFFYTATGKLFRIPDNDAKNLLRPKTGKGKICNTTTKE